MSTENTSKNIYLYILQLVEQKFYVGQSVDPGKRIKAHFNGKGSAWTKKYEPISVLKKWNTYLSNCKEAELLENKATLLLMYQYGWENVRGGFWSHTSNDETFKNLKHHEKYIEDLGVKLPFN